MNLLSSFLSKFATLQSPELLVRNASTTAIKNLLNIEIPQHTISYQHNRIVVQGGSSLKHALMLHKVELLEHIQKNLPESVVAKDIC
jgi:hypothetical protein